MAAAATLHDTDILFNRNTGIGGSDAKRILDGDWHSLWLEKTGQKEPENLDDIFRVQLGKWTEPFHVRWFGKVTGFELGEPTAERHPHHQFMFAHFDAWVLTRVNKVPLQVKHSNAQASHRESALYYMPQIAHECAVAGVAEAWFSVIPGNGDPLWGLVEPEPAYIDRLIEMETAFWWHVEERVEPEIIPHAKIEAARMMAGASRVGGFRAYDYSFQNEWVSLVSVMNEHEFAAQTYENAVKGLKALVPEDAAEVTGGGIVCKRDRAGRLRFSKPKGGR